MTGRADNPAADVEMHPAVNPSADPATASAAVSPPAAKVPICRIPDVSHCHALAFTSRTAPSPKYASAAAGTAKEIVLIFTAMGVGLRNHAGVAARIFQALTDAGVNMLMISTSEIKLTIFIKQELLDKAVKALNGALGVGGAEQA